MNKQELDHRRAGARAALRVLQARLKHDKMMKRRITFAHVNDEIEHIINLELTDDAHPGWLPEQTRK